MAGRCHMCRNPVEGMPDFGKKITCVLCEPLLLAPCCLACGERVRDAEKRDKEPYHKRCRRCSSCCQIVDKNKVRKLAGRICCVSCSQLFGEFFNPSRRPDSDHMREAFKAWDADNSGSIEKYEIRRVLKALDPDFSDRELDHLMRVIDSNGNGKVEIEEFVNWISQPDPLGMVNQDRDYDKGLQDLITNLMRETGSASHEAKLDLAEIQVRADGLYTVTENEQAHLETTVIYNADLQVMIIDPEEFICSIECNERGLLVTMNTGRVNCVKCKGAHFSPFCAPEGFHIVHLLTKPKNDKEEERVCGIGVAPLPSAASYDNQAALAFTAERELLSLLREILSKASIDVNSFDESGMTPLMKAAAAGSVGAIRMLLAQKIKKNICDSDGWTALTYASRFGHTDAVQVLLEKGASDEGDGGAALKEALRQKHNNAARALLRAGFGPSPKGTFAVEDVPNPKICTLGLPLITPGGGAFGMPIDVRLLPPEGCPEGTKILYTLDCRDPFLVGRVCRGLIHITGERTHLRAVAVHGKQRSNVLDCSFTICHYVMPDEIISGSLRVSTFPEAAAFFQDCFAKALGVPTERVITHIPEVAPPVVDSCWVRIKLTDPRPHHRLIIHMNQNLIKGSAKQHKFLEKFVKDVETACAEKPGDCKFDLSHPSEIHLDFTMPREKANILKSQLQAPGSYLENKAALKTYFQESEFGPVDCLAKTLFDQEFQDKFHEALPKKLVVEQVVGLGNEDTGILAVAGIKEELKQLKNSMEKAAKKLLPKAEVMGFEVCPREYVVDYKIDAMHNPGEVVGKDLVQSINSSDFNFNLGQSLKAAKLPHLFDSMIKATSRVLVNLEFRLQWEIPQSLRGTSRRNYLDGSCVIYAGSDPIDVVDFRSRSRNGAESVLPSPSHDGKRRQQEADEQSLKLRRGIARCIQHSGDETTETGAMQRISIDMTAVPGEVTDIYFVLSAYEESTLATFTNVHIGIYDVQSNRKLTSYRLSDAGATKAAVMCSLSRPEGKWIVQGVGKHCLGNVNDYEPVIQAIADRQNDYDCWVRRKHLVLLRVMLKLDRLTESSTSNFAKFIWGALRFPTPVFQRVVQFF